MSTTVRRRIDTRDVDVRNIQLYRFAMEYIDISSCFEAFRFIVVQSRYLLL